MDTSIPTVTLSNGVKIPILGLGTSHHGGYSHESVIYALKHAGYTHIDTAVRYGSETNIGTDIKTSGIQRENLFLTTKIWPASYGYETTKRSLECSLANLNTKYVDLYLMHWPDVPYSVNDRKQCLKETWLAMEELYNQGKCRAIGVSNYLVEHLEELLTYCSIKPHINQIEVHPYCYPKSLIKFCKSRDIIVEGYSPLAKAMIIKNKKLRTPMEPIAQFHNKTISQVLIRWSIQHGVVTIPKSTNKERLYENIDVFDFELTEGDMEIMDRLSDVAFVKATWDSEQLGAYRGIISRHVRNEGLQ